VNKKILFIGEFPPPYTGVTVKDSLIVEKILEDFEIEKFNLYKFKFEKLKFIINILSLLTAIKKSEFICIGVGHPFRTCTIFRIAKLLHGKDFLQNIIVFMMGIGTPDYLKKHPASIPDLAKGRCIFTESEELNRKLNELGCWNTKYLPNFRNGDKAREPQRVGSIVKFVYFAQVRPEKGIETLIDAVKVLNNNGYEKEFTLSIYGNIIDGYEERFRNIIAGIRNIFYMGAFDSTKNDVYLELNKYDASSSSSSWREGMSGTNIECKFAGIANIVSDAGFNPECVEDGVDGLLVKAKDVESLVMAMRKVITNHDFLYQLKIKSFESRSKYDANNWKEEVIQTILC